MDLEKMLEYLDTLRLDELQRLKVAVEAQIALVESWQQPAEEPSAIPDDAIPTAGGYLRLEYADCGKARCKKCQNGPSHGPYWYRYTYKKGGGHRRAYVGKVRPT